MTHLTLTGYDAGKPLCDVNKVAALANGEKFYHAMFYNFDAPYAADTCPKCKAEWDAAADDDDDSNS